MAFMQLGSAKAFSLKSMAGDDFPKKFDPAFLFMISLCITMGPDWPLAQAEFARVGLNVERFDAIVEDNRPLAFNKSVYACMEKAKGDSLLLFEDDVIIENSIGIIDMALRLLPTDVMTLHFGCNIFGTDQTVWRMPDKAEYWCAKLYNAWQSHATYYSVECVQYILDNFNPNVLDENNMIFDEWLRIHVLNQGRSYVINPMICYQRPRHSEIWNQMTDYTGAHRAGNEWMKNNLR